MSQHAAEFLDRFFQLFFSSFLTNIAVGVLCGLVGLFIVLRRMVFVSAALSQVAGAGLAFAFLLGTIMAPHQGAPPPPVRVDEQMDTAKVDEDVEEIRDTLQNEFPDLDEEGGDTGDTDKDTAGEDTTETENEKVPGAKADVVPPSSGSATKADTDPPSKAPPPKVSHHKKEKPFKIPPALMGILFTVIVSLILARRAGPNTRERTNEETVVGLLFILGSALTLVFSAKADKAAHEIQDVLFGVAVLVPTEQQHLVAAMGVVVLFIYFLMFKDFLFASFDPTVASVAGFPVGWSNAVLFVLIAVVISVCTRAVGAMPVFALTILPATAALLFHERIVPATITTAVLGGVSAGAGYFATGIWELPVGPCIVLAATIPVVVAVLFKKAVRWRVAREERKTNVAM